MPTKLGPGVVVAGRYRLDHLLGEGGMGAVWSATHTVTGKPVAMKFLKAGAESPEVRRRFAREARAACIVSHRNVREVYDVLEIDDELPVMIMERLEGESLAQRLDRETKLPLSEAAGILVQVVSAVGTAHSLGIIHRDLKPENVFLTEGSQPGVKVLDFGIAKVVSEEQRADTAVTATGTMMGTPCYMAPEQVFGEKTLDHRIDIWALGLVAYRALTGVLPTSADNVGQVMKIIVTQPIRPIQTLEPSLPADIASTIGRMLSRNPDHRPADLLEVWEVLAKHTDANAPAFPRPSTSLRKTTDEKPAAIALGDATTISAEAAASGSAKAADSTPGKASGDRAPAIAGAQRRRPWAAVAAIALVGALAAGGLALARRGEAPGPVPATSASAAPTAVAVPITALPSPSSTNDAAVLAYRDGLRALRAADWDTAEARFDRALELDPDMAAAAVQLLVLAPYLVNDQRMERYRTLFRRAQAGRDRLTERDAVLLDALQPFFMKEPPDRREMDARIIAASRRFAEDAELAHFAGAAIRDDEVARLAEFDRAVALDPDYADAIQEQGRALWRLGRTKEAFERIDACLKLAPGSQCAGDRVTWLSWEGECAAAEAAARAWVLESAGSSEAYGYLAAPLAAVSAPDEAVVEVIRQEARASRAPGEVREGIALAHLDVLRGRFSAAERHARELLVAIDRRPDAEPHDKATQLLVEILRERGDGASIAKEGEEYFRRRSVWSRGGTLETTTPAVLTAMEESGKLPRDEALRRLADWRKVETGRVGTTTPQLLITYGAGLTRTPEEAGAILAELGAVRPPGFHWREVGMIASLGRLQLLVGQREEAAASLTRATRSCSALNDPFTWVRAHLWLGDVQAAREQRAEACAAYGEVLRRWGVEKPLGRTASRALEARKALGCP